MLIAACQKYRDRGLRALGGVVAEQSGFGTMFIVCSVIVVVVLLAVIAIMRIR